MTARTDERKSVCLMMICEYGMEIWTGKLDDDENQAPGMCVPRVRY